MSRRVLWLVAALLFNGSSAFARDIAAVVAHPVFGEFFSCAEHWEGQLIGLGDELGADCTIHRLVDDHGRVWMRAYANNGRRNEDWFGWGRDVLAPCSGEVVKVSENRVVNRPGVMGKPPASFLLLRRDDGVFFMLAHVAKVRVKVGDKVSAGDVIAQVGNNGYSRQPHIHIGAWKGEEALQIRFDQVRMGRLFERAMQPSQGSATPAAAIR